jgi:AraC-like DNA-binding protein
MIASRRSVQDRETAALTEAREWQGNLEVGEFSARWRGAVGDSVAHRHFAAQAVIGAPSVSVEHAGAVVEAPCLLIEPNVPHRLVPCAMAELYFIEPTLHARLPDLTAAISARSHRLVSSPSGLAFWEGWLAKDEPAPRDRRLIDAMWLLDGQLEAGPVRLAALAGAAGLSPDRFRHLFVEQLGIPLRRYILWRRLRLAAQSLAAGDNVTAAAHGGGFSDAAHLARTIKHMFGINAGQLLQGSYGGLVI